MKTKEKSGISLISLIITIIVVIILAVAIILAVSKNNPVTQADVAVYKQDVAVIQDILNDEIADITLKNMVPPVLYMNDEYVEEVTDKVQINEDSKKIGKLYYIAGNEKGCIVFGKEGSIKAEQVFKLASTETTQVDEITYRYTNQELPTYNNKSIKWYVTKTNNIVLETEYGTIQDEDSKEDKEDNEDNEDEWVTYKTEYYEFDAGKSGQWISCETDEDDEEDTKIEYSFSKSNDCKSYTEYTSDITENGNSRYIKVKVEYQRKEYSNNETILNDIILDYIVDQKEKLSSIKGENGLVQIIKDAKVDNDVYYSISIKGEEYTIHTYAFEGNQVWDSKTFGDIKDVGAEGKYAENMVVVKVNGDLTINSGAIITAYNTEYGGPKGMLLCVTGTLINNGTISMTARGAYAEGQDVYLWKNTNGNYEYVPATGALGGSEYTSAAKNTLVNGKKGNDAIGRKTGGGGSGGALHGDEAGYAYVCCGGTGTSYSGGTGSGAINENSKAGPTVGLDASYDGGRRWTWKSI